MIDADVKWHFRGQTDVSHPAKASDGLAETRGICSVTGNILFHGAITNLPTRTPVWRSLWFRRLFPAILGAPVLGHETRTVEELPEKSAVLDES